MNASIISPTPIFHRTESCPTAVPEPSSSPFQQLHSPTATAMMMKLRQTSASPVLSEHGGSVVLSPFMSDYQPTPTTVGDNDVLLSPPIPWTFPTSLSSSSLAAEYPFGLLGTAQQDNGHFLNAMMSSTVAPESDNSLATQDPSTPSITPLTSPSPIAEDLSAAQAAAFAPEVPAEWMLPSLWYGAMQQASAASFLEQAAAASMYRGFPPAALNPFLHRRPVHAYPPLLRAFSQGSTPAMMLSEKDRRSLNASPSLDTKPLITLAVPLDSSAAAVPLAHRIPPAQAASVPAQKRKRAAEPVPPRPVKLQRTEDGSALPPPSEVSYTSPDIKPVMIDDASTAAGSSSGSSSKKPVRLSKRNFDILMRWLMEHSTDPFPDKDTKETLMNQVGLSKDKLEEWFINARRRYLKRIKVRAGVYMYEPKEGKAVELLDDGME
ncbi:hypothetical protein BJ742DRAFT_827509 [Cladochytrium replicatum]|nr:hypothetical protein BJ742DRAFT_827509 [Cladochytrium replicatum]